MHQLKIDVWKVVVVVGILFFLFLPIGVSVSPVSAQESVGGAATPTPATLQATPTVDLTVTVLAKQKLQEDVAQEQRTSDNWLWTNGAALLSVLVIVVGSLIGFLRWLADQRKAREDQQAAHEKALQDQQNAFKLAQMTIQTERELAADNQREIALQAYIDKMSDLLLNEHLSELKPEYTELIQQYKEAREIARVRTLTVLSQLDPTRKKTVLRFLYESGLINAQDTIVDLSFADLREVGLHRATLTSSNLSRTNLCYADLSKADLSEADLTAAELEGANLNQARLLGANLSGIFDFQKIKSMKDADLREVKGLTKKQLLTSIARGAIIDEDSTVNPPKSTVASPLSQDNDAQTSPATPAQVNKPPPGTDGSSGASSQP